MLFSRGTGARYSIESKRVRACWDNTLSGSRKLVWNCGTMFCPGVKSQAFAVNAPGRKQNAGAPSEPLES